MKVKQIPAIPQLLYGNDPDTGDIHFLWPDLMKFLGKTANNGSKGISSHATEENRRNGPVEYPNGRQEMKVNSISFYGLWQYLPKAHKGKEDSNRTRLIQWINEHLSLKVDDEKLEVEACDHIADNEAIVIEAEEEEMKLKKGNEKEPETWATINNVVVGSENKKLKTVTFILDDVVVVEEFAHDVLHPHNDEFVQAVFAGAVGMGDMPPVFWIQEGVAMQLGLMEKEAEARNRHNQFEKEYQKKLWGPDKP